MPWSQPLFIMPFLGVVQNTVATYHRLGGLNNRSHCLTLLEARSQRSRGQQVWLLLRPLSLPCRWLPSCYDLTWSPICVRTSLGSFYVSQFLLIKMPVIVDSSPPWDPRFNLKALFPNTVTFWITGGQGFSIWILGKHASICNISVLLIWGHAVCVQLMFVVNINSWLMNKWIGDCN